MTDDEAHILVLDLVRLLGQSPDLEDAELAGTLEGKGYGSIDVSLAVALVPTVFARLALRKLGDMSFSPWFIVNDRKGRWVRYHLSEQPVYRAANRVAMATALHGDLSKEQYQRTASRSAEFGAVSKALDAGSPITGGAFAPLAVLGVTAEELGSSGRVRWWERLYSRA